MREHKGAKCACVHVGVNSLLLAYRIKQNASTLIECVKCKASNRHTSSLVSTLPSTLGLARRASLGVVIPDSASVLSGGGPLRG